MHGELCVDRKSAAVSTVLRVLALSEVEDPNLMPFGNLGSNGARIRRCGFRALVQNSAPLSYLQAPLENLH
jgi:hypothetical protein